jgi:hypothetical protein
MLFYSIIGFPVVIAKPDLFPMFHFKQLNYRFMFVFHHLLSFGSITLHLWEITISVTKFRCTNSLEKRSYP